MPFFLLKKVCVKGFCRQFMEQYAMQNPISYIFKFIWSRCVNAKGRSYGFGWSKVRKEYVSENPRCEICGYMSFENDVHHIIPRHVNPSKLLDKSNFITLCRKYNCHLRFGHFGNYKKYYNPRVREMFKDVGKTMWEEELKIKQLIDGK